MAHFTSSKTQQSSAPPPTVSRWVDELGKNQALDTVSAPLRPLAKIFTKNNSVRNALKGNFMGHALHPLLTDLPMGFWMSALTLDFVSPRASKRASQRLTGLGILSAVPTAAAGLVEWSETASEDSRIGAVHAMGNTVALTAFIASYLCRRRGRVGRGRVLGLAGGAVLAASGFLGGHLAIARKVGSHTTSN